jgi:16S rRNA (cytosine967-C5)-methyltransferase
MIIKVRALKETDWMDELGVKELGEKFGQEITAQNQSRKSNIKGKHPKTNKERPKSHLNGLRYRYRLLKRPTGCLVLKERANVL